MILLVLRFFTQKASSSTPTPTPTHTHTHTHTHIHTHRHKYPPLHTQHTHHRQLWSHFRGPNAKTLLWKQTEEIKTRLGETISTDRWTGICSGKKDTNIFYRVKFFLKFDWLSNINKETCWVFETLSFYHKTLKFQLSFPTFPVRIWISYPHFTMESHRISPRSYYFDPPISRTSWKTSPPTYLTPPKIRHRNVITFYSWKKKNSLPWIHSGNSIQEKIHIHQN